MTQITITEVPIGSLKPHPKNSRTHSDEQVNALARNIQHFGWTKPIVADEEGVILIGHGRWAAAKALGLQTVPAWIRGDLTDGQKRALLISDNRLSESKFDDDIVQGELRWLVDQQYDLSLTAFDLPEYQTPEDEPEAAEPDEPVVQPGDIWTLSQHMVICTGDADPDTLAAYFATVGGPTLAVGWAPPEATAGALAAMIAGLQPRTIYLVHDGLTATAGRAASEANYQIRAQVVIPWDAKPKPKKITRSHACMLYCASKKDPAPWFGGRKQTTVWDDVTEDPLRDGDMPQEVVARLIASHTAKGDAVCDPWATSPVVLVAAHQAQRRAITFFADPAEAETAIATWEAFTGRQATHAATGETYHERRENA